MSPLELLLADGVIDQVVGRLKSGKEADIYLVEHAGEVVAAKIYKEREVRSFKNNAGYKEGRTVRNSRTQRAMDKGSRFGQAAAEEAWKSAEADALYKLHAQGVRVPTPVMFIEGVLLMQLVLDPQGQPASRLIDSPLTAPQAGPLYLDLLGQIVKMLCCDLIHGDLSPYNVLLGEQGATVIDFPQVVGAAHNSQAEALFRRDVENIRKFLATFDHALLGRAGDAGEIWRAYTRRELSPDFMPSGKWVEEQPPKREHEHGRHRAPHPGHPKPHGGGGPHAPRQGAPHGGGPHAPRQGQPHGGHRSPAPGQQRHGNSPQGGRQGRGDARGPRRGPPGGGAPGGGPPSGTPPHRGQRPAGSAPSQNRGPPGRRPQHGRGRGESGPVVSYVGRPPPGPEPESGDGDPRKDPSKQNP